MSAHSSLKVIAGATIARNVFFELSAQSEKKTAQYPAQCTKYRQHKIEVIWACLHHINEPKKDHFLVLSKCKNGLEALEYFLKHAEDEFIAIVN